eukprot:g5234.t1
MKRERSSSSSSSSSSSDACGARGSQLQRSRPDAGPPRLPFSLAQAADSLAQAAEENRPEEIKTLAATDGLDISAPWGDDGLTALHRATLAGSMGALRTLLDAGASTNIADAIGGRTPLHFAALTSGFAAARALLLAGADTEPRDEDGRTPLHLSIIVPASQPSIPLCLLEAGAAGSAPDALGMTPLDIAVRNGRTDVVRAILRRTAGGAPAPCPANLGLLYEAVRGGDAGIVDALVGAGWEAGVPPVSAETDEQQRQDREEDGESQENAAPVRGCGVLAAASGGSSPAAVLCPPSLSEEEASCRSGAHGSPGLAATAAAAGGETLSPLMLAADSGRPSVVRAILRGPHRGFPNAADSHGYTALHFATMRGSVSIVEALLGLEVEPGDNDLKQNGDSTASGGNGVSPDGGDDDACSGRTAAAAAESAAPFADPDVVNADGDTALHVAIATRRVEVAEPLLRAGASVRVANLLGFTALHFAAALGLSGLAARLLEKGADVAAVEGAASAIAVSTGRSPRGRRRSRARASTAGGGGGVGDGAAEGERRSSERQRPDGGRDGVGVVSGSEGGGVATAVVVGGDSTAAESPQLKQRSSPMRVTAARSSSPRASLRSSSPKSSPRASPTTKRARKSSRSPSGGSGRKGRRAGSSLGGSGVRGGVKDRSRKEGRTPLHYAAMNGRVDTARVLLEAGAPVAHRCNGGRESPLFAAAKNGHAEMVELLLGELGPGAVDAPSSAGETPLSVACAKGHADVVDQLLRGGAEVTGRDASSQQSVLDIAASVSCPASCTRILKALLEAGGENRHGCAGGGTEDGGPSTSLRAACRAVGLAGLSAVKAVLEGGADANAVPPAGEGRRQLRPLHVAAVHGNVEAVSALTLRGCRLDAKTKDPSKSTPLVLAVEQGHTEAARVLIEAGAAIDVLPRAEDGSERAPSLARLAADMGRADLVTLLAKALIDRDSSETLAAEWAAASPAARSVGETAGNEK